METVYFVCAVAGGSILVLQVILIVIGGHFDSGDVDGHVDVGGGGGDLHHDVPAHDGAHDAQQVAFLKVLTFKTLVAFLTFFGLAGLACGTAGFNIAPTFFVAVGAGTLALYLVAYLMSALYRLQSEGNVDLANAVGQKGKAYLRIPAQSSGSGKVTLVIQGRSMECRAMTPGPEIPTGAEVRVVGIVDDGTLEVVPAEKE